MALSEYIIVTALTSRPLIVVGDFMLESKMVAGAVQEYFTPSDEEVEGMGWQAANAFDDGAIPVVHILLKDSLLVTPEVDFPPPFGDSDGLPIPTVFRPTDLWVEGFLEDFYGQIMGARATAVPAQLGEPLIDYYSEVVTDTTIDFNITPVLNADTYYVTYNGILFQNSSNTSISLTGLEPETTYAIIIQARKSDLTFRNSPLNAQAITTTAIT